jgi:hypothetical protein
MNLRSFVPSRFALSLLVLVMMAVFTAQACGPDFYPDVFILKLRPDHPKEFAAGKLGVLLPTYPRADLTVAFRYLNEGVLTPAEQKAYNPVFAMSDPDLQQSWARDEAGYKQRIEPADSWRLARAKYAAAEKTVEQNRELKVQMPDGSTFAPDYLNCNGDAFLTAEATLASRAQTWGEKSPDLADWLKGQDAVFSNCRGGAEIVPPNAPAGSSALLKEDRAYQAAAAEFYAAQFEIARRAFQTIAQDPGSPWQGVSRYLVARCLIRQAFLSRSDGDWSSMAKFDPALMQQADSLLQSLLKEKLPGISRKAIQDQLDLVRLRTEPTVRLRELSDALAGPRPDLNYNQNLTDLTWYLDMQLDQRAVREDFEAAYRQETQNEGFDKTYAGLAQLRDSSTLVDWLITFQSPATEAKNHAIAEWKSTGKPYWFLAAISKATERDAAAPELVSAAESIPVDSPAWESFTFHRLRLLVALGRNQEARQLLDQTLPQIRKTGHDSSVNAFLGLRMRAAENLREFLSYAPRKILSQTSESQAALDECLDVMKNPQRNYECAKKVSPVQFSADAAGVFNTQAPLIVLVDAANSPTLPDQLRGSIVNMAWVRSVLLNDSASAAKLFPLLPEKLQQQAGSGMGFHALMSLLRNPGLRPYLDPGVQRSYSYDFVESYADNWWCQGWQTNLYGEDPHLVQTPVAFLTPNEINEGQREAKQLMDQKGAAVYLGTLTLDYANAHPEDKDVPESLYLVLRMIRYGCDRWDGASDAQDHANQVTVIRKEAARLLRQRYAASPWTRKAAPYVG